MQRDFPWGVQHYNGILSCGQPSSRRIPCHNLVQWGMSSGEPSFHHPRNQREQCTPVHSSLSMIIDIGFIVSVDGWHRGRWVLSFGGIPSFLLLFPLVFLLAAPALDHGVSAAHHERMGWLTQQLVQGKSHKSFTPNTGPPKGELMTQKCAPEAGHFGDKLPCILSFSSCERTLTAGKHKIRLCCLLCC